eukprot:CAMPEP_0117470366 /NCGR_PEP_ID=MMETSP0784-20121206/7176_1 /TAXON_ID=39447 /ORGANISM="" /LENGTH=348 /DNA_ID=CAMNT_0005264447 /DNA_START=106 /DNA_END=1149 /DNA_ORIENTATION=-
MVATVVSAITVAGANSWLGSVAEVTICVFAAMVVLRLELQRRGGAGAGTVGLSGGVAQCKQILQYCAPEVAGVVACLTLAALLRARGDTQEFDAAQAAAWEEIKSQWPLLLTADTLLSLQAMLRVVLLISAVLRAGTMPVPFGDEVAAFSFGAHFVRGLLAAKSASYMLDGPLGGKLPVACEVVAIPLLGALGAFGTLRRCPLGAAAVVAGVAWLASRHHLSLGEDRAADELFIAAHVFELLAALAYLVRSVLIGGNDAFEPSRSSAIGFTHLLMAAQQSLATYYFLRAFDAAPELVGAGLPFQVLHIGCALQLGVYLAAAAIFLAERFEAGSGAAVFAAPDRPAHPA